MFISVEAVGAGATWAAFAVALKTTAVESETFAVFAIASRGGSGLLHIRFCGDFLIHYKLLLWLIIDFAKNRIAQNRLCVKISRVKPEILIIRENARILLDYLLLII